MADNLVNEGTAIFSGNFVFYTSPFWYSHLGLQNFAAWLSKNSHKRLIPFFLLHTPEIGYSFQLKDPTVLRVLRAITKNNLYLENGYPLVIPDDKYPNNPLNSSIGLQIILPNFILINGGFLIVNLVPLSSNVG